MTAFCFSVGLGAAETGGGGVTALGGMAGTCSLDSLTRESTTRSGTLAWGLGLVVLTACLGGLTAFFCGAAFEAFRTSAWGGGTFSTFRSGLDGFSGKAVGDDEIS